MMAVWVHKLLQMKHLFQANSVGPQLKQRMKIPGSFCQQKQVIYPECFSVVNLPKSMSRLLQAEWMRGIIQQISMLLLQM